MRSIFNQSKALDEKMDLPAKMPSKLKLINRSKSTVNESHDVGLDNVHEVRFRKIEKMKKEGFIDFSYDPKYCQNFDNSINFETSRDPSLDMVKKIEI